MARSTSFRNLVCIADLFFALSASLFLLSAQERKTLEGDQPLVERRPDPKVLQVETRRLEKVAADLGKQLEALQHSRQEIERQEASP